MKYKSIELFCPNCNEIVQFNISDSTCWQNGSCKCGAYPRIRLVKRKSGHNES